ncbi:DUF4097 family beta strand repeat protein [Actinosynnema pretiosum subsp. pretiosum]|uniref:DUF4097 domain-containing protein n=2 Tax=Actinosynnema TaxID=40566 RepID=C6WGW2_ACTMD|nr:DUF4097 family beta strand repeat-containing protein [Actinosynnema mirum]ACU36030.1 hypothetical protein Amir_2084 [Actinosynnema mirum DSM 43827]AXX29483.1 hypothetical protein APASM_2118 [Actinosynnema pretiosum subsp. pretiosum]QUF06277.1 DUF4097 family beta strand repeat protein [Actinosynnema pretiosum subsp. pretiosum]
MPEFDTPAPITAVVELAVASVRVTASDRATTAVHVRPTNPADDSDVKIAAQVTAELVDGELRVTGPRAWIYVDLTRKSRSVDLAIDLPAGSAVTATVQAGNLRATGLLGECSFKTGVGDITLDRTGPLRLHTAIGHAAVTAVDGDADLHTSSGRLVVGEIRGSAQVKNSNGPTRVDEVTGDIRVRSANGDIEIGRAGGVVDAKSANGHVKAVLTQGSSVLESGMGDIEVGVVAGTSLWLDARTGHGRVESLLDDVPAPDAADRTAGLRARTAYGDITVRRA